MTRIRKLTNGRKFSLDVEAAGDECFVQLASRNSEDRFKSLIAKSWKGIKSGCSPTLCEAGVGGTYFMRDEFNRTIGVFKPQDEEMGGLNNPKGFTPGSDSFQDDSAKRGVHVGEAAFRECAAYLLDHEHFSGVPATDLVVCSHPCFNNSPLLGSSSDDDHVKIGSFQEYKDHDYDAQDISPSKASKFPVKEVHKIAILDIRLLNTDRHGGNILVRQVPISPCYKRRNISYDCEDSSDCDEGTITMHGLGRSTYMYDSDADENGAFENQMQFRMEMGSDEEDEVLGEISSPSDSDESSISFELIPIDHGYTLPHTLSGLSDSWFEWLYWPQAKVPFCSEHKAYIARLDADEDISLLRQKFGDWIRPECFKVLKITTMWLKKGAVHNLTPYDIGVMMCRRNVDMPSDLELMCWEAEESLKQHGLDLDGAEQGGHQQTIKQALFFENLGEIMDRVIITKKLDGQKGAAAKTPSRSLVFDDDD